MFLNAWAVTFFGVAVISFVLFAAFVAGEGTQWKRLNCESEELRELVKRKAANARSFFENLALASFALSIICGLPFLQSHWKISTFVALAVGILCTIFLVSYARSDGDRENARDSLIEALDGTRLALPFIKKWPSFA